VHAAPATGRLLNLSASALWFAPQAHGLHPVILKLGNIDKGHCLINKYDEDKNVRTRVHDAHVRKATVHVVHQGIVWPAPVKSLNASWRMRECYNMQKL